jgi:hypothetical protein
MSAKRKTTEQFIEGARARHGDTYDYSLTTYHGAEVKVRIICKIHGVFSQLPAAHNQGCGCPVCGADVRSAVLKAHRKPSPSEADRKFFKEGDLLRLPFWN